MHVKLKYIYFPPTLFWFSTFLWLGTGQIYSCNNSIANKISNFIYQQVIFYHESLAINSACLYVKVQVPWILNDHYILRVYRSVDELSFSLGWYTGQGKPQTFWFHDDIAWSMNVNDLQAGWKLLTATVNKTRIFRGFHFHKFYNKLAIYQIFLKMETLQWK